jgi:ubiquinone/menaquinone biosynthesis C-methylase UbiE
LVSRRQADRLGLDADLRVGDAQALDLPDAGFETVVRTLSLCASPTNGRSIAETWRVLRRPATATGHVAAASRCAAA